MKSKPADLKLLPLTFGCMEQFPKPGQRYADGAAIGESNLQGFIVKTDFSR